MIGDLVSSSFYILHHCLNKDHDRLLKENCELVEFLIGLLDSRREQWKAAAVPGIVSAIRYNVITHDINKVNEIVFKIVSLKSTQEEVLRRFVIETLRSDFFCDDGLS